MPRRLEDHAIYQLVKLKLGRMLYGSHADSEDMDSEVGVALVVLTLPGVFLSLLLFNKYGSLLRFLRGQVKFDPYLSSLPDEYLFIVLAMLVSGGVALWKWDTLLLDRRDTVNIVPLPIHTRQIFLANLLAVLLFAMIFCLDVNAGSAVLFPLVVSASQESFLFFGQIAVGHALAVLAASIFSFASVFAVAGVSMALLSTRAFQAISVYLRALVAVVLLLLFASAFTVSARIAQPQQARFARFHYLPSMWFLGMCQWARGAAGPVLRHLALLGLLATAAAVSVGAVAYGIAYQRHFSRLSDVLPRRSGRGLGQLWSAVGRVLDRTVFRTCFEQAAFRFIARTFLGSDRHRVTVAVFAAVGLVAAAQSLMWSGRDVAGPTTGQFAAPLIVLYCCILGLRYAFEIPTELNANWIFRFLIAPALDECATLAGKAMFLLLLPGLVLIATTFALIWSAISGILEFVVLAVLSATLAAALVISFRKLPFTCAKAGFQHNALLKVLLAVLGAFAFAIVPASIQHWALYATARLLLLVPLLALVWWAIYARRSAQLDIDRQIAFHDPSHEEFELLNLNA